MKPKKGDVLRLSYANPKIQWDPSVNGLLETFTLAIGNLYFNVT